MVMATAPFWMYALDVAWRRGSQMSWGCPLLLRWPPPQPAQSAGDEGAASSVSATIDDDGMAADGDDIEMRSTRGTASTRATLSTVHLRPSEAPSFFPHP
jgi:hypothetical protein